MIKKLFFLALAIIGILILAVALFLCSNSFRAQVWEWLHDPYCILNHKIQDAIEERDFDAAQKYVNKLAKHEEKLRNVENKAYILRTAENYQSLLYELQGKYEDALKIQQKWKSRIRLYSMGMFDVFNVDYCAEARLLYKLNRKDESFVAYCEDTRNLLNQQNVTELTDEEREKQEKAIRKRVVLPFITRDAYGSGNPDGFFEFPEFLKFAEEEYAKLGEPEEYADAMTVFRTINSELDEQTATPEGAETTGQAEPQ